MDGSIYPRPARTLFRKRSALPGVSLSFRAPRAKPLLQRQSRTAELTRINEALRLAEERFRGIFENSVTGIYQTSPEGRYLQANFALARLYGYASPRELLDSISDIARQMYVHPERREEFRRLLEETDTVAGFESEVRRADEGIVWISENARAVRDGQGVLLYYEGMVEDVTARKQAEEEQRDSEQRMGLLVQQSPLAVIEWDLEQRVTEWNRAAERIFGYTREEALGRTWSETVVSPEVAPQIDAVWTKLLTQTGGAQSTNENRTKNGTRLICEWYNAPLIAEDGQVVGIASLAQDVTESHQSQERIQALNNQLEQRLERVAALRKIDTAITSGHDMRHALRVALDQAVQQLQVDAAAVLLALPGLTSLQHAVDYGLDGARARANQWSPGRDLATRAWTDRARVTVRDASQGAAPEHAPLREAGFCSYMAVPLVAKGRVKGVLEVYCRAPLSPDREWIDYLETLAGQCAVAVENAALFDGLHHTNMELIQAYDETIEGWSRALDLRDRETEGHTQRVTDLTVKLARALGSSEDEIVQIRRGALLHDIGKMGIPDQILLKPGPLTDDEWRIMRLHPVYAHQMLRPIAFLRPALDIPYAHHEKWDGTGYPQGLCADEISRAARLFAVVDVWDALCSDRPYRRGWPEQTVLDHIRSLSGTHFDPEAVDAFLRLIGQRPAATLRLEQFG